MRKGRRGVGEKGGKGNKSRYVMVLMCENNDFYESDLNALG